MASGTLLLSGLWPPFAAAVQYYLQAADYYAIPIVITSGYRDSQEQERLYRKGRTPAEIAASTHKVIGVGGVVTNARGGQSAHNYGLAIDVDQGNGSPLALARAIGFGTVTGDPNHIEWPGWRTLLSK